MNQMPRKLLSRCDYPCIEIELEMCISNESMESIGRLKLIQLRGYKRDRSIVIIKNINEYLYNKNWYVKVNVGGGNWRRAIKLYLEGAEKKGEKISINFILFTKKPVPLLLINAEVINFLLKSLNSFKVIDCQEFI